MKNTARRKKLEVEPAQLTLADVINAGLHEFLIAAGTAALDVVLEHERTRVVGPCYVHLPMRTAHRAGPAPGELVLVKRWRNGKMILRWTVAAIADAATRFRRITSAREGMTQLVRALKDHENALAAVAPRKQAPEAQQRVQIMSDARNEMIRALKAVVVPRLRDLGFKGSFPHFRRRGPTLTDLLTFQFDRHGGGFVLELGQCDTDFSIVWPTGERVRPDEITPGHLPLERRARIEKRPGSGTSGWFRYDDLPESRESFERTARGLLPFLDEAERIFAKFTSSYLKER